ncbi:unnamed protein product [Trifolium pratense]|uniref:Uncharacterized protein n=1 Tax=Trifolium pratense TaxID=57577 RepID=A0ACB0IXK9_TRIPR|nr:unnamed protein product [Trifolium pratense]
MINLQTTSDASHWNTTTRLGFGKYRSLNKADKGINFSRKGFAAIHTKMNLVEEHVEPPRFWQIVTTAAHIQGRGVMHFPNKTSKHVLPAKQDNILMRDVSTGRVISCTIITSSRYKNERYLGDGWYQFKDEFKLNPGDVLKCSIENPPQYMNGDRIQVWVKGS